MDKVVYGSKMKKVDSYTIDTIGIPSMVLMERAAFSIFTDMKENIDKTKKILCLCGMGNNGADGIALARMLQIEGYEVKAITVGDERKATKQWHEQKQIAISCGTNVQDISSINVTDNKEISYYDIRAELKMYDYVVDALFGIGLTRNVEGIYKELIESVNDERKDRNASDKGLKVYAVDVPSGLCADTGKIMGTAMYADKTFTFGEMKTGLLLYKGKDVSGERVVCDIGFPLKAYEMALEENEICSMITMDDIKDVLPRQKHSNKSTYGKVLVVAGSKDMYGAAYFTSRAVLEMGCGLVKIITHENNRNLIYKNLPEVMISTYGDGQKDTDVQCMINEAVSWSDAIVIGPGLSKGKESSLLVKYTMSQAKKLGKYIVIDADGLNIIADNSELTQYYHERTVITPHIGEAARLMGEKNIDVAENIMALSHQYARENRINVVLKDATTVILGIESYEDKCNNRVCINTSGNPGMATGGSGDVLAGMIGGILAGGVKFKGSIDRLRDFEKYMDMLSTEIYEQEREYEKVFLEIALAVYIHGVAGDFAAEQLSEVSMTATDILNMIHKVING